MPNIAKMLKDEIQRLARHEIKAAVTGLHKENSTLRRTVADLKRRLGKLESTNKRLVAKAEVENPKPEDVGPDDVKSARITAKMIRSIRGRLGLSQDAFARMVGVSQQSVYQWERAKGRLKFRGDTKQKIVSVRSMSKHEVREQMEKSGS